MPGTRGPIATSGAPSRVLALAKVAAVGLILGGLAPAPPEEPDPAARAALRLIMSTPFDDAHAVEIESGESSAAAGEPYFNRIAFANGVWQLRQRAASGSWENYGLTVLDGRTYWASLNGPPRLMGASCATCHANGPRAISGALRAGSPETLRALNRRIAAVGLVRPFYTRNDQPADLSPLTVAPCVECHDGVERATLTRENAGSIRYRVGAGAMPPNGRLSDTARAELERWLAPPAVPKG